MKVLSIGGLLLVLAIPAAAQTFDDFFNDSVVQELRIDIRPSDWENLKLHYLENTYYAADVHWKLQGRDIPISNVGVRSRGRGSRSPIKPNLRIDINRFEPRQRFTGVNSFILKANNQDASELVERIAFQLFARMGLPASREAHARVFINDTYLGLYLLTEEIRKEFIERHIGGGEGDGDLYEWKPIDNEPNTYNFEWRPSCTFNGQVACSTSGDKWAPRPFDPQENKATFDIRPTIQFFRMMTEASDADFVRVMADFTDLKLFMIHNGLEVFLTEFDSLLGDVFGANNFWLYRFIGKNYSQFIVWDKDGSFNWSTRPIFQNANKNVLFRRALALPDRRYQYLEALYKSAILAGGAGGWMEQENQRVYFQVREAARTDPNKQFNKGGVLTAINNDEWEAAVVANGQFCRERYPFVIAALAEAGFQLPPGGPTLGDGGAVNAATNVAGPIAPGSLVSLYGTNLTTTTAVASVLPLPTTLGNVSVFVNGFAAPLLFVSPGQINLQIPWELGIGDGTAPIAVIVNGPTTRGTAAGSPVNGTPSNTIKASVGDFGPGVFAVVQADGSLTSSKPAGAGDVLIIYANGLGAVDSPVATGQVAPSDRLIRTTQGPTITIGGVTAQVLFSGLAPGFAGLYQVNVQVPAGVPAGASTPLVVSIGGQTAPPVPIATR